MIRRFLTFIVIVITVVILVILYRDSNYLKGNIQFLECVDGDTAWFLINEKKVKVRFLGIDAPEIAHSSDEEGDYYGEEAKNFTCSMLSSAHNIRLLNDPNSDSHDKYDRMLAWVFVDDVNLNLLLVEKGYAQVKYIYHDYLYVDDLCMRQSHAYKEKLGIWEKMNYSHNYCVK